MPYTSRINNEFQNRSNQNKGITSQFEGKQSTEFNHSPDVRSFGSFANKITKLSGFKIKGEYQMSQTNFAA